MGQKRVLVTGSSRGIGRAIAERLAHDGWSVALHCTSAAGPVKTVADGLGAACSGVYKADLSDPNSCEPLIKKVLNDGPLDALVNNAGVYLQMSFLSAGEPEFEANLHRTFAVNFESPVRLMRKACSQFAKQGGGKVLNVASRVGFRGEAHASLYAASKAALINMTRSLAVELAAKNVGIFGIAPGWVETAMAREGMADRLPTILKDIPMGKMASPADCAATAAFLLSDEAAYLSGVTIDINGASYFH